MKQRSIIFSAPMIRRIQTGEKTQTRRIVVPRHIPSGTRTLRFETQTAAELSRVAVCPYGQPGDLLWVRETFMPIDVGFRDVPNAVTKHDADGKPHRIVYRADADHHCDWCSPIHMPRWASRFDRRVTSVRIERLQTITAADVLAEGIRLTGTEDGGIAIDVGSKHVPHHYWPCKTWDELRARPDYRDQMLISHFAAAWDTLNAKRATWASNPWVWVVGFERVEGRAER